LKVDILGMQKRSKRYSASLEGVDANRSYPSKEAIDLVKKTSTVKFDASVEVHVRLGIDPKQTDQSVRFAVKLPHGTGKKKRIAAFVTPAREAEAKGAGASLVGGEELIAKIKQTEKLDFDVAVAEPAMMKNLAAIAKILGTKGKMPSPKTGSVSPDITRMIQEIAGGKVESKNDDDGNIHQVVGKVSFETEKLEANLKAFMEALRAAKPKGAKQDFIRTVTLASSMGPGFRVSI